MHHISRCLLEKVIKQEVKASFKDDFQSCFIWDRANAALVKLFAKTRVFQPEYISCKWKGAVAVVTTIFYKKRMLVLRKWKVILHSTLFLAGKKWKLQLFLLSLVLWQTIKKGVRTDSLRSQVDVCSSIQFCRYDLNFTSWGHSVSLENLLTLSQNSINVSFFLIFLSNFSS